MKSSCVTQVFLLGVAGYASLAMAQTPGTFAATGNMTTPRSFHTATLLSNGKVLIAGGSVAIEAPTATAELYDQDSGTFSSTGSMTTPRMAHSATLLPDGKVLIAGGTIKAGQGLTPSKSAEIYDPSTETFVATGNLLGDHVCQQAYLLGNGKVLIAGGTAHNDQPPYAELYDPATGTFAATGKYVTDTLVYGFNTCEGSASTLLADGRVLIVWEEDAAEIYDPQTGAFTETGKPAALSYGDGLPTASLLMNGKVLVAGGADDGGVHKSTELFDLSSGSFTPAASMSASHTYHSATLLASGIVMIAGGVLFGGTVIAATELYDPVSDAFRTGSPMLASRCCHTATSLNDGRVLIAGGTGNVASLAELYTPDVLIPAPVLLSVTADGQGQGAILHAGTARLVTVADPAVDGEALEVYCTGLAEGSVIPPQVVIGGRVAPILYFGKAPGFPNLNQVNIRVPAGAVPGSAVPVRLNYLNRPSNAVTIAIQE